MRKRKRTRGGRLLVGRMWNRRLGRGSSRRGCILSSIFVVSLVPGKMFVLASGRRMSGGCDLHIGDVSCLGEVLARWCLVW